jgi:hypothetical protein
MMFLSMQHTKAKPHSGSWRVPFGEIAQPRWGLKIIMDLGFFDVAESTLSLELEQCLEVAILKSNRAS